MPFEEQRRASRDGWLAALLLAVAIAGAYANSLHGGYHFDDWHVLELNPHVRMLSSIPRFFLDPRTTTVLPENQDLRPILMVTFAVTYAVAGERLWAHHLVTLLLHWCAALLAYRIVRDHLWLDEDAARPVAIGAALIVALHPLNTEPVNYLSARSAVLTAVFYWGAFDAGVRRRWILCGLLLALALLTKAIAVTLPVALLIHQALSPASGASRLRWRPVAVLGVVAVAGLLYRLTLLPSKALQATHPADLTPWVYFMTGWSAYLYYIRLFVWPDALVVDRLDYPVARSLATLQAWGSLVILSGATILAWRPRRKWPLVPFAVLWYLITLAPESTVFPLAEPVNEHRPYLAMLGPASLTSLGLWQVLRFLIGRTAAGLIGIFSVCLLLLSIGMGVVTHRRNELWKNDYLLWKDATLKVPTNPRAWLNAGHAALVLGRVGEARSMLLEGRRLSPCYAHILINLSAVAARQGNRQESLRWATEAVRCRPALGAVHQYHGAALERLGRQDEATEAYRRATELNPQNARAWIMLGKLLERRQRWTEAASAYDQALVADPREAEAAMLSGLVLHHRLGSPEKAVERYKLVLEILPTHYGAHYQLAIALRAAGDLPEARAAWARFEPLATAIGDERSLRRGAYLLGPAVE